jgi:hypothetical protein
MVRCVEEKGSVVLKVEESSRKEGGGGRMGVNDLRRGARLQQQRLQKI